jgi:hypothetical protein
MTVDRPQWAEGLTTQQVLPTPDPGRVSGYASALTSNRPDVRLADDSARSFARNRRMVVRVQMLRSCASGGAARRM